jgi:hypothetical protein
MGLGKNMRENSRMIRKKIQQNARKQTFHNENQFFSI